MGIRPVNRGTSSTAWLRLGRALPFVWYPAGFAAAITAFAALLASGVPPAIAAYLPTVTVGLGIIWLERYFPERPEWRPRWEDIKADAAFMGIVQIALPQALAALSVVALAGWRHERAPSRWWPHDWPLWIQIATVVLAVDFMRYWLHRGCHRYLPLWRLHEVHHSPDILYVLNVGRFHPLEKTLHFALDTAPFLFLGVAPEVVAGYFLMYSVNGLFQHSNIELRYGWLNYVMGSAETHRWHHARDPDTAACNFSNTTIVWDLVFGTWRLPSGTPAVDIGIMDRSYPQGFWDQMQTPFRPAAGPGEPRWRTWIVRSILRLYLRLTLRAQGRRLQRTLRDPMRVQRDLLQRLLAENRATTFGRQHGFDAIRGPEDFSQRVPVSDYERLRPFIDAEIAQGEKTLTDEAPRHYVRTSGTTGKAKDVPLTPSHLRALRRIQRASLAFQFRTCPEAFSGKILGLVGSAEEGRLANGKPFGSASGIVAGDAPGVMRDQYVVPAPVFTLSDSRLKYLTILRLAIAQREITYIGSANPTTLLALIKLYREHQTALLNDLRQGTFFLEEQIPPEVRRAIAGRLRADPARADELQALSAAGKTRVADLWPKLRAVSTWTCASAGVAVTALRRELDPRTRLLELGYIASEFRGTITLGRRADTGLPTFDMHYFEFVERNRWDRGEPEFLTLDRVRKGVPYYIIVTTPSGLYRYFINDLVEIRGFLHRTPLLKFLQKGKGVTSITGEKLYENQVLTAVQEALAEVGGMRFVMMLADEVAARYHLYVEPDAAPRVGAERFGESVDAKLAELNIEYAAKRESGRLHPLSAAWLAPETGEAYKQFCLRAGQREGQFKTVALAYRRDFGFDLDSRVEKGRA